MKKVLMVLAVALLSVGLFAEKVISDEVAFGMIEDFLNQSFMYFEDHS